MFLSAAPSTDDADRLLLLGDAHLLASRSGDQVQALRLQNGRGTVSELGNMPAVELSRKKFDSYGCRA
jgi:hypothetical protein